MDGKIKTIEKNDTQELRPLPKGHEDIELKLMSKIKKNTKRNVKTKGYRQNHEVHCEMIFVLVVQQYNVKFF